MMASKFIKVYLAAFGRLVHGTPQMLQSHYVNLPMKPSSTMDLDLVFGEVNFTSSEQQVMGHIAKVSNPIGRFSVVPPLPGGCGTVQIVKETAKRHKPECVLATDGGDYTLRTPSSFSCTGNIVADGEIIQTQDVHFTNVNFGVTQDDEWIVGYMSPEDVNKAQFKHLIEGLGWIVHEGKNYVNQGLKKAYINAGISADKYASMQSGRTGVGYTADGQLIILQYDGNSKHPSWGANLYELANEIIKYGAIEAINMDGGGSTRMVYKGVEVGYSSDGSTYGPILCVHGNIPPVLTKSEVSSRKVSVLIGIPIVLGVIGGLCCGVGIGILKNKLKDPATKQSRDLETELAAS